MIVEWNSGAIAQLAQGYGKSVWNWAGSAGAGSEADPGKVVCLAGADRGDVSLTGADNSVVALTGADRSVVELTSSVACEDD